MKISQNGILILRRSTMYCKKCGAKLNEGQIICTSCGVEVGKGNEYCSNCGSKVVPEAVICVNCGVSLKKAKTFLNTEGVKRRDIVKAVLLSIVTCGIYNIFWFINVTNDMNRLTGNEKDTAGGVCFVLNLITCGIYGYYWAYQMGKKRDMLSEDENGASKFIYIVLCFFGLTIVAEALMQDAINKAIEE